MIVDSALYVDGQRREGRLALEDVPAACLRAGAFVWLGLYEPTNEEFEAVRTTFGLHELAVEDAVKAHQRPKLEAYDDSLFLVLKTARYLDAEERVEFGEILVFVGQSFIVHVRHGEAAALSGVRRAVEARDDLLRCGPGAVLHAIVDHVVDDYGPVIAGLENDIGEVELDVFSDRGHNPVQRIYMLKREVLELHQASVPLEEALDALYSRKFETIHEDIREYFRDVHDHVLQGCRAGRHVLRSPHQHPVGQPHLGHGPPERGHAQDLGLGVHRRRPHHAGRHLRHELRAHAGARLGGRLPAGPGDHGGGVRAPVPVVPAERLAVSEGDRSDDVGGDPVCWAHLQCPECGAIPDRGEEHLEHCPRCGAERPPPDS